MFLNEIILLFIIFWAFRYNIVYSLWIAVLMRIKILKVRNSCVWGGGRGVTFNIFLRIKAAQNLIDNYFENANKISMGNKLFLICTVFIDFGTIHISILDII